MGLFGSLGLKNSGKPLTVADVLAALVGQDIVAKSISLTQALGSVAVQLVTGARLKLGGGTTDYLTSDGTTGVVAAGALYGTTDVTANTGRLVSRSAGGGITVGIAGTEYFGIPAGAAQINFNLSTIPFSNCTLTLASTSSLTVNGTLALDQTDSSGTPGNATINKLSGRSAIAAGASSCVISNNLVTAAARIFISPKGRDATGLLPIVSAQVAATSFTVSTTANCTGNLTFDWWVLL